jgi:hypothetical protein
MIFQKQNQRTIYYLNTHKKLIPGDKKEGISLFFRSALISSLTFLALSPFHRFQWFYPSTDPVESKPLLPILISVDLNSSIGPHVPSP